MDPSYPPQQETFKQGYAGQQETYPQQAQPPQPQPYANSGQAVVVLTTPPLKDGVREWSYGLFGCFGNCGICILSWCCPCYLIGKNAEYLGESFLIYALASLAFPWLVQFYLRIKIRSTLAIQGSEVLDCCSVCWCQPCALVQEHTELLSAPQRGEVTGVVIQRQ